MPGGMLGHSLLLAPHRLFVSDGPTRRSIGHIGDVPVMVGSFYQFSIVVRQRKVKSAAGLPSLGLRAG
jgi:hypothetical protein